MVVTKTICQHSGKLPEETMDFLRGIAADYAKVKTAVYERCSGIGSVERINHIYDIQTEMRNCGLRQQLRLPVAYYEMAIVEAVANIKSMWSKIKDRIREAIRNRDNLTDAECRYIRTVLKLDQVFAAVLQRRAYEMPRNVSEEDLDIGRLNNLIRRLVRRYVAKPKIRSTTQFKVIPAGYKYKNGGLYLVSRVPRRRICLPLKDTQTSTRQIRICIKEDSVDIHIFRDVEIHEDESRKGTIYIYIGYRDALTLSNGHVYGQELNKLVSPETERLSAKNAERSKIRHVMEQSAMAGDYRKAGRMEANNLGRKKYEEQKRRVRERTQNYINAELNRMLAEEKPERIVITRTGTVSRKKSSAKELNRRLTRSFGGYIRRRLEEKCRIHGIELLTISSKDTASICSQCGKQGARTSREFHCGHCGFRTTAARNTARNIEKKAISAGT
ncbi:MAG: transposase [Selenomonadaceae bacterium]|nr:transposase [Selenomonadaceae bacterium]